jgi:phosphoribosyl 1,2-cyclic phosphodiesterase
MVSDGTTNILLDCGLSWREIQKRSGFKKIDSVLVSHSHKDHSKGIQEALKMGVNVWMPKSMYEFEYRHHNAFWLVGGDTVSAFGSGMWKATAFDLVHDMECLGYCIDIGGSRIVYITDTLYCKYTFPGVTHFLIECNNARDILNENVANGTLNVSLRNRVAQNHMDIETVKGILMANDLSKVEAVYLLHLSNDNSDAERFKREVEEATGKLVIVA